MKIAYYNKDKDEFIYKGKARSYDCTANIVSFLRNKDKLVLVENNKEIGEINASVMSSYISGGYGSVYKRNDLFNIY